MKTKMLMVLLGGLVLGSGCVKTVNDQHTWAVPFEKDKFESRYERTPDQVYSAALDVIRYMGTVSRESVINPGPNQVKTIEGKINGRTVWARVQAVDQKVTSITVQVRGKGGGSDLDLTQEIQKQIAIKLATG
jgi:hypothetical protein